MSVVQISGSDLVKHAAVRTGGWRVAAAQAYDCLAHQHRYVFPGSVRRGVMTNDDCPPASELIYLAARGGARVAALFGRALSSAGEPVADARSRLTVLFFYGNEMSIRASLTPFDLLRRLGVNVLLPDYLGYGISEGTASEHGCYATADAAFEHLGTRTDIDPDRIVAAGVSLGGAVAIDLASRRSVRGVATLVTFTSIADMSRRLCPGVNIAPLLRYRFESEEKIRRVRCPILIGHSTGDTFIPYEMADRLAAAAGGPVTRLRITGADHNETEMLRLARRQISEAFGAFFAKLSVRV